VLAQVIDIGWEAVAGDVVRRGGKDEPDVADLAADQIAVSQRAHPDGDIETFANDIDETITDSQFEADLGITLKERRRPRRDQHTPEFLGSRNPDQPPRGGSALDYVFGVLDCSQ
jgi:hypothetical protein